MIDFSVEFLHLFTLLGKVKIFVFAWAEEKVEWPKTNFFQVEWERKQKNLLLLLLIIFRFNDFETRS